MASTYSKRLAKLEELLASRLNQPLATLWLDEGVSREEACIKAGYDVSQIDRLRFVRWLRPDEVAAKPPSYSWDQVNEPGPPDDEAGDVGGSLCQQAPAQDHPAELEQQPAGRSLQDVQLDEDIDRRAARRLTTEKLFEATKAFAKTIV